MGRACASCAIAVTEAIEPLRRDKVIGSSLEAEVTVPSDADPALLAELFIVSSVRRGDAHRGDQDRQPQMRPLLAAAARGQARTATCARAARRW